jgi:hypothetical protein
MRANPSVYLLDQRNSKFVVYLGEFTTQQGMSLLPRDLQIESISLGTTDYKDLGWATEDDLPTFRTSKELLDFISSTDVLFLTFEVHFKDFGAISTHDDGECHFELLNKSDVIKLVTSATPDGHSQLILSKLFELQNKYLALDHTGHLRMYHTFDQYLKDNKDI